VMVFFLLDFGSLRAAAKHSLHRCERDRERHSEADGSRERWLLIQFI
jgi:hypothetical protein